MVNKTGKCVILCSFFQILSYKSLEWRPHVAPAALMLFSVWTDHVDGGCPVKLTSVQVKNSQGRYSQDVILHVRLKADGTLPNHGSVSHICL